VEKPPRSRRRKGLQVAALALIAELLVLWRRGYGLGGQVVVRCRDGHLFTTLWIPGVSVKSARLGWWRFQRCPVGDHWSLVTPEPRSELSARQAWAARRRHDVRLP
jgi:hypothetical protein